jgi:heavy metal efflux system protein
MKNPEEYMRIFFLSMVVFSLAGFVSAQSGEEPLSLSEAVALGMKNNPEIKCAAAMVDAARGRFWSAIAPSSPELSATSEYIPAGKGPGGYGEQSFGITQSIDFPTKYWLRGSKGAVESRIAREEYDAAKFSLAGKIKVAYFNALAMQAQRAIAEDNSAIAEDFVKKSAVRHAVGEGTGLEQLTAKVQHSEAVNGCENYDNRLKSALGELRFVLGFGGAETKSFKLVDSMEFRPLTASFDSLLTIAVERNPALKISRLRLEAAAAENALACQSLLPDFSVSLYRQRVRDDAEKYYGISIGATIPLWGMLDHQGKIREAKANAGAARSDLKNSENELYFRTLTAYNQCLIEQKRVDRFHTELLPQAKEIYRIAAKSYEAGEIGYIEFLQAQKTLIEARSGYVEALLTYNLSLVSIEDAVGMTLIN